MEERLIDKRRRLHWIVNFVNNDIDSLSKGDYFKTVAEIEINLKTLDFDAPIQKFEKEGSFPPFNSDRPRDTPEWRSAIQKIQQRLKKFLLKIIETKEGIPHLPIVISQHLTHTLQILNGKIMSFPRLGKKELEYEFACLIYDCSPDLGKDYRSISYIKRCQAEECPNFFLQFYKKRKKYCSNECAWRAYSADRRSKEKKREKSKKGEK